MSFPDTVIRVAFVGGREWTAAPGYVPKSILGSRCKRGHELTDDNVTIVRGGRGNYYRNCKACQRERGKAYRARLRGE